VAAKRKQMSGAEAKILVADQDRKSAVKALAATQARVDRAKASYARAGRVRDKAVALAVSAKPDRDDWYSHPGPVPAREVRDALGLSTMQLHRLMERYRKRAATIRGKS
jgi:hypothetical protein